MSESNNYRLILEELDPTLSQVDNTEHERSTNDVIGADHIFTAGEGRSGFVANNSVMRLNRLGKNAYVVGESTTPSIKEHDLLTIISGSGSTEYLRLLAEKTQSEGAKIVLLTTNAESPIGNLAKAVVELPVDIKHDVEGSKQPLGSLLEQASLIFLDSAVLPLMDASHISGRTIQESHANSE